MFQGLHVDGTAKQPTYIQVCNNPKLMRFKPSYGSLMTQFLWSKFISVNKISQASGRLGKVCTRQGTTWAVI